MPIKRHVQAEDAAHPAAMANQAEVRYRLWSGAQTTLAPWRSVTLRVITPDPIAFVKAVGTLYSRQRSPKLTKHQLWPPFNVMRAAVTAFMGLTVRKVFPPW